MTGVCLTAAADIDSLWHMHEHVQHICSGVHSCRKKLLEADKPNDPFSMAVGVQQTCMIQSWSDLLNQSNSKHLSLVGFDIRECQVVLIQAVYLIA